MATRGDDGGAKSRPSGTLKNMMDMLPFEPGVIESYDSDLSISDSARLLAIVCRETIVHFIDGKKFVDITGIPLEHASEREFREHAAAVVAHPFFEDVTVSYEIVDINTHPGSPRNLWADFKVRWK
jgi:hypothetical protein